MKTLRDKIDFIGANQTPLTPNILIEKSAPNIQLKRDINIIDFILNTSLLECYRDRKIFEDNYYDEEIEKILKDCIKNLLIGNGFITDFKYSNVVKKDKINIPNIVQLWELIGDFEKEITMLIV